MHTKRLLKNQGTLILVVSVGFFLLLATRFSLFWSKLCGESSAPRHLSIPNPRQDRCRILGNEDLRRIRPPKGKCPGRGTPLNIAILSVVRFRTKGYHDHVQRLRKYADIWGYGIHLISNEDIEKYNLKGPSKPTRGKKGRTVKWTKVAALRFLMQESFGYDYIFWTDIDNMLFDFSRPLEYFIDEQQDVGLFLQEKNSNTPRVINNHAFIFKTDDFGRNFIEKWLDNAKHGEPCLPDQMTMLGTIAEYLRQFSRRVESFDKCWEIMPNDCLGYNQCVAAWMDKQGFGPGQRNADTKIFYYRDIPGHVRLSHNRVSFTKNGKRLTDCDKARGAFSVHAVKEEGSTHPERKYPLPCPL